MIADCDAKIIDLLTEPEAARKLRISQRKLFGLRQSGQVPCVRIGSRGVLYDVRDLMTFVDANRIGHAVKAVSPSTN
jgi:hypothetical protein